VHVLTVPHNAVLYQLLMMCHGVQDTLIVGGPAAWGARIVAFALYGSLFEIAPGLFLWPFYLVSALWVWFVWRPTWYASAIGMSFVWGAQLIQ
jgi:hypothetical protein